MSPSEEFEQTLAHYGVKGMRWGHSNRPKDTPRSTERAASGDAKEFARAKMYYGEGAGVRRRLINNTVKSRSSDPKYKEAFERHLGSQDMAKRAAEARTKRARTDVVKTTAKTSRGVVNVLKGNMRYASAASVILVGAAAAAHKSGVDRLLLNVGKQAFVNIKNDPRTEKARDWFKR